MKAYSLFCKMVAVITILFSTVNVRANDGKEQRVIDVAGFNEVTLSSALELHLVQGDTYKVIAIGDSRDLEKVNFVQVNKNLRISRTGHSSGSVRIEIVTPELNHVTVSGACTMNIENVKSNDFSARVSGASTLRGNVKSNDMDLSCSGASNIIFETQCKDVDVHCSGASNINLKGVCRNVKGSCSGASDINLRKCQCEMVDVRCSGASSVSR